MLYSYNPSLQRSTNDRLTITTPKIVTWRKTDAPPATERRNRFSHMHANCTHFISNIKQYNCLAWCCSWYAIWKILLHKTCWFWNDRWPNLRRGCRSWWLRWQSMWLNSSFNRLKQKSIPFNCLPSRLYKLSGFKGIIFQIRRHTFLQYFFDPFLLAL